MEADLTSSDDPPEYHAKTVESEGGGEVLKDHTWLPSKELSNKPTEPAGTDPREDDEAVSGESGLDNPQNAKEASKKSPCKLQQGAIFSGKILSFCCSECKGDTTYSPNDLLKHFQGTHKGSLPTYPCDLCSFVTNEFAALQRHRIGHRNTLVTCEICNDGVQYSLLLLTRHYIMCHSRNGHFHCEKCEFSTRDAGTFVQHIHHHNENRYKSARKDYLSKHVSAVHSDDIDRMNKWRSMEDSPRVSAPGLKLLLKKSPVAGGSREPQWMSKLHSLPGVGLLDQNGRLLNPEKTLEETQQFLERAVGVKKESNKWNKASLKSEPQCSYPVASAATHPKVQENDLSPGAGLLNPSNTNGLTVLMVKNKISIPPNCTTKVMGFKMVDGKKHLVLKVIPTKQETPAQNEVSPTENCHSAAADDGERTTNSPCSLLSPVPGEPNMSGTSRDLTTTIKVEAPELEPHDEDLLPLQEERDKGVNSRKYYDKQVSDLTIRDIEEPLPSSSASPCSDVDSSKTKESQIAMHTSSQPNEKSPPHAEELPDTYSTEDEIQSSHSVSAEAVSLDSSVAETTSSDSVDSQAAPLDLNTNDAKSSRSVANETTPSNSVANETTPSDSVANETTPPDSIINETTPPDSMINAATPTDSIVNDLTPTNSVVKETTLADSDAAITTPSESVDSELMTSASDSVAEDNTLVHSIPTETMPSISVPSETMPSDSVPTETMASDSVPTETMASDSVPTETMASDSVSTETMPSDSVAEETMPSDSGAEETMPSDSVPEETMPSDSVPEETMPSDSVPTETMPSDSVPTETMPSDSVPTETMPSDSVPTETKPSDSIAEENMSSDSVAEENMPLDSSVLETTPLDSILGDSTASEVSPQHLIVIEDTLSEASRDQRVKSLTSDSATTETATPDANTRETASPESAPYGESDREVSENEVANDGNVSLENTDTHGEAALTANHSPAPAPTTDSNSTEDPDPCEGSTKIGESSENHVEKVPALDSVSEETPSPSESAVDTLTDKSADKMPDCDSLATKIYQENFSSTHDLPPNGPSNKNLTVEDAVVDDRFSGLITGETTQSESIPQTNLNSSELSDSKDSNSEVENSTLNSPNQEVFSFHNYSKETSSSSPDSLPPGDQSPQLQSEASSYEMNDIKVPSDWSLTLPASPPPSKDEEVGDGEKSNAENGDRLSDAGDTSMERVSDSDIEVDECVATVDDSPLPTLPESENATASSALGRAEGESTVSCGEKATGTMSNAAVLGKILEKHSDAIISQQLEKERLGSSAASYKAVRPTKTMLRILQTPEGKQQMFLQTSKTPYAVPVQLKGGSGFKLLTKSCASKINVSYVKPGMERPGNTPGLALTLNSGRIGPSAQGTSEEENSSHLGSPPQGPSSSRGHYLVNASALKGSLLLSGPVKSSGEQATNTPQTCYLVQRPLPASPSGEESASSSSQTLLTSHPVLAMPVNSADKTASSLQTGRQAYLVRYISPAKSGLLVNSSDGSAVNTGGQSNEPGRNRVFLKIVRSPNGTRFLSSTPYSLSKKPIYLAAGSLQKPCLLMSSNKSFVGGTAGLRTSGSLHDPSHKLSSKSQLSDILSLSAKQLRNKDDRGVEMQKSQLVPSQTRQLSQRKRRRRALFEEYLETSPKSRRISGKSSAEKNSTSLWEPVAKDVERTLRLSPFSPLQQVKCPRYNQPVVVLNHPDADIPEVARIMRSVNRYRGEVLKVALSQSTVKALSKLSLMEVPRSRPHASESHSSNSGGFARKRPLESAVRERFILKLKLKKTSRNRYEVVKSSSNVSTEQTSTFGCWFCGRVFGNQEEWIGHGQRHLMEATRDWNKLF
ncbi:zinc finger protein 518A [Chanos chanos]|uniref:Zinc finger protein 518A n=1 Tax=Chanos chanos TaxID=29144 RepID=A0A6J2VDX2_CHACN|nr:zinc finger protein 518A-like [Chanos chanos]